MRTTSKGQVTIPVELRERFGLLPNTEVEFRAEGNAIMLLRAKAPSRGRGRAAIDRLRGTTTVKMTTDAILALTRSR